MSSSDTCAPFVPVRMTTERELKLVADERFRLPKLSGKALRRRVLTSVYFDTPQYALARGGITLRHRVEAGRGVWQLKLPTEGGRREIEARGTPDLPPPLLSEVLLAHVHGQDLKPVAKLRTTRHGVRVSGAKGPIADVVLDRVVVVEHRQVVQRFSEVEIERLNGDESLLTQIEQTLRRAGAGDHDGRPKLFRALGLPAPASDEPPLRGMPPLAHMQYYFSQQVAALLAYDPGTRLGVDSKDLHQMRVAIRRLRAMLRAAKPLLQPDWVDGLREELKWLGKLLGPARDLDVQIAYFREEAKKLEPQDRRPLQGFVAHLRAARKTAQGAMLEQLKSGRYLDLVARLQLAAAKLPTVPAPLTLADIAGKQFRKLRREMRPLSRIPSHAELHRIRILAKRARYAAELAKSSTGKQATRFIKEIQKLQDLLGMHQDAVLADQKLRAFADQSKGPRVAFVAGRMVERQRQRQAEPRSLLPAQWKKLEKRGQKAWG